MNLVIVSAAKFEALPLLCELNEKKISYTYFELGIGPLATAKSEEKLEALCHKNHVIFLGTCGSFAPFEKPYLIKASKTYWMPTGVRTGISDFNHEWYPPISFDNTKKNSLASKIILTSPEISLSKKISCESFLEASDECFENMELYPVAKALNKAHHLDIILAVTNELGPTARKQWQNNFKESAKLTKDYVLATIL